MSPDSKETERPFWYKDAVIYELHVKSFYDAGGDGMGDFRGLIQKLDYLQELGITAVWLLPFYPSPLKDDGYDISDYLNVNPDYGTLSDFRRLLREAHKRDIRVITELVVNHTSDQHKWFQRARRAKPGSVWRDFYVWSDTPDAYRDARIIFQDFESSNWTWDSVAQAYYWHRFYSHQPDLNYDNPRVRKEIFRVLDFWFGMGVDGLRLDAVPYLYQREGTNCENLPETHAFLKELRAHVDEKFDDRMLLAEANQWPEDAAEYFGDGDECHMAFHFPVMPRLFMALRTEDRFPVVDILDQSLDIPETCQWAMFLRNHDELTLEMVTDEERDYMYRVYAQDPRARINLGIRRRLAPLLDNNRRRIELLNILLLSLPGTPVIYYGDEIGMGDNYYLGDRDGVRTPMQWSADRNAGFSSANPQKLFLPVVIDSEYHYAALNVETQRGNLSSLFWFMRRAITMRKRIEAFGRGDIEFLACDNPKILAFTRKYEDQIVLVVANLSRFCQVGHLRLAQYAGLAVEELFSGENFPDVTEQPYVLTLTPHSFYWLALCRQEDYNAQPAEHIGHLAMDTTWTSIMAADSRKTRLARICREYMKKCRWFGGKGKKVRRVNIADAVKLPVDDETVYLLLLRVSYAGSPPETYLLPISFAPKEQASVVSDQFPHAVIAELELKGQWGVLYDAVFNPRFRDFLLLSIVKSNRTARSRLPLSATRRRQFKKLLNESELPLESRVLKVEQSNTSIVYADRLFLKLYRRLEMGTNPDEEISRSLTEHTDFRNFPAYAGTLRYNPQKGQTLTLGLLLEYVPNESDGWAYMLDAVGRYFDNARASQQEYEEVAIMPEGDGSVDPAAVPVSLRDLIGSVYIDMAELLGRRTAEMHLALASLRHNSDVQAEPFSMLYQKSVYQSMRGLTLKTLGQLEDAVDSLAEPLGDQARAILNARRSILSSLAAIKRKRIQAMKIRIHGDYHLGQVLYTGKDFVVIDFEGEPARSLGERRLKRSVLRDVAGMMRSFHYAAYGSIFLRAVPRGADADELKQWADLWYSCMSRVFLHGYMQTVADDGLLPANEEEFRILLDAFLLEKAIYELGYELNNRPDWIIIPIRSIQHILERHS